MIPKVMMRVSVSLVWILAAATAWCVTSDALLRNQIGDSYFAQGDYESAVIEYREAIRLSPDYPTAHYNLATVLDLKLGRGPEALEHYRTYLSLSPTPLQIVVQRIEAIREKLDYVELMGHVSIGGAETYLANHPQGANAAEVRGVLARLIDKRRQEEEVAKEQLRLELEALGQPDAVERWAWLWTTWEIRWFRRAGTALVFAEGQLKQKLAFPPLERQDETRIEGIRSELLQRIGAARKSVEIVTPSRMTTSGLLDHLYIAARERLRAEGSYVALSESFDKRLRKLLDDSSVLEPTDFIYTRRNDVTGADVPVIMPGYRARCDIGLLPVVPVGSLTIPSGSKITRVKIADEVLNVLPGQSIPLPADRYRIEIWAGSTMKRVDVDLGAQQTVTLPEP